MIKNTVLKILLLSTLLITSLTLLANPEPSVTNQIVEKAKANDAWKVAFVTGKQGQIVFMNVSPTTNPQNEIGKETHPFDQIILIAAGDGKAILNDKNFTVKTGDLIFIPQGTVHNVINTNSQRPLKIISFYSNNDIPANAKYAKKSDEPKN